MWCRDPNFIHIHYPKTAGHTVRRTFGVPAEHWDGHRNAQQFRDDVGQMEWDLAFKFTFVRNPYDMVVSAYEFNRSKHPRDNHGPRLYMEGRVPPFSEWVRTALRNPRQYPGSDWGARTSPWITRWSPQCHWHLVDGLDSLDYVGRVENLEDDLRYVGAHLGIEIKEVGRHNSSKRHRDYRPYYDDETAALVEGAFAEDLELFDYAF